MGLAIVLGGGGGFTSAADGAPSAQATEARSKTVDLHALEAQLLARRGRVAEFNFIRDQAKRLGLRAWLFGGTAAGYAHYVKWDLQRNGGDSRFQDSRFDYDYTNIYRSTQDLDIVVDGPAERADELRLLLQQKYPHLQGSKTAWEVRLLREASGDKEPLLGNPDFLNQHTDSNSTGMIELTDPPKGERVVRDLRDWGASEPHFLKNVADGELHYYFSPLHGETSRFRRGLNPPIFSVVRYLTKAFQYELGMRDEDLKAIRKIVADFDPARDLESPQARNWLEKNGKKLIQHAVNIEYAVNTLDSLGLRKVLAGIGNNPQDIESLTWWMGKEPLREKPLGEGEGRTAAAIAKELGLEKLIAAHETRSYVAFESITRAHTGDPNVLISRMGRPGESAEYGDGFYVAIGREGRIGTGLTVRFEVDPRARCGTDFLCDARVPDFLVFQNKKALRVVPESLNVGALEFFQLVDAGEVMDHSDLGILEKLRRRVGTKLDALSPKDERKLVALIKRRIAETGEDQAIPAVVKEWFSYPVSLKHPELLQALKDREPSLLDYAQNILSNPLWRGRAKLTRQMLGTLKNKVESLEDARGTGHYPELLKDWFALPASAGYPRLAAEILKTPEWRSFVNRNALAYPHWTGHPELIEMQLQGRISSLDAYSVAFEVLSKSHWIEHPSWEKWVGKLVNSKEGAQLSVINLLKVPRAYDHLDWFKRLANAPEAQDAIFENLLPIPEWTEKHPWVRQYVKKLVDRADPEIDTYLMRWVLGQPQFVEHPEWIEAIRRRELPYHAQSYFIEGVLTQPHWAHRTDWMIQELSDFGYYRFDNLVGKALSQPFWADRPELAELLLKALPEDAAKNMRVDQKLFEEPHWRASPRLRELCEGGDPNVDCLRKAFKKGKTLIAPGWIESRLAEFSPCSSGFRKLAARGGTPAKAKAKAKGKVRR